MYPTSTNIENSSFILSTMMRFSSIDNQFDNVCWLLLNYWRLLITSTGQVHGTSNLRCIWVQSIGWYWERIWAFSENIRIQMKNEPMAKAKFSYSNSEGGPRDGLYYSSDEYIVKDKFMSSNIKNLTCPSR